MDRRPGGIRWDGPGPSVRRAAWAAGPAARAQTALRRSCCPPTMGAEGRGRRVGRCEASVGESDGAWRIKAKKRRECHTKVCSTILAVRVWTSARCCCIYHLERFHGGGPRHLVVGEQRRHKVNEGVVLYVHAVFEGRLLRSHDRHGTLRPGGGGGRGGWWAIWPTWRESMAVGLRIVPVGRSASCNGRL